MKEPQRPTILVLEGLSGTAGCIRRAGAEALTACPYDEDEVFDMLDKADGIILTGGGDVDPRLYGQQPHKRVYGVSEMRDYVEWMALDYAADNNVPVMGICRGSQLINVHMGGTLTQHVPSVVGHGKHGCSVHKVESAPATLVRRAFRSVTASVKSLHHQAVEVVGDGLRASAWAEDGTIEAIESFDGRVLGVQFHPEMRSSDVQMQRLFDHFALDVAHRSHKYLLPRAWMPKVETSVPSKPFAPGRKGRKPIPSTVRPKVIATGTLQLPKPEEELVSVAAAPARAKAYAAKLLCSNCGGMKFDEAQDWIDHKLILHHEDVTA